MSLEQSRTMAAHITQHQHFLHKNVQREEKDSLLSSRCHHCAIARCQFVNVFFYVTMNERMQKLISSLVYLWQHRRREIANLFCAQLRCRDFRKHFHTTFHDLCKIFFDFLCRVKIMINNCSARVVIGNLD